MSWQARLPPALNALFEKAGIHITECARLDGRFTLDIDQCGLVDLIPVANQWVVFDAMIGRVAPDANTKRKQITQVLARAASRILDSAEVVTLSEDEEQFRLQLYLDTALSPVDIEQAVEDYLNAIEQWRVDLRGSHSQSFFH